MQQDPGWRDVSSGQSGHSPDPDNDDCRYQSSQHDPDMDRQIGSSQKGVHCAPPRGTAPVANLAKLAFP